MSDLKKICDCVPPEPDPQPCRCRDSANEYWRGREALWFWQVGYEQRMQYQRDVLGYVHLVLH